MTIANKIGAALAASILVTLLATGIASADTSLEISGNGEGSTNTITTVSTDTCAVEQKANTYVEALVGSQASTGGNTANNNTGGATLIDTGNATSTATVTVVGGSNTATDPCCCQGPCPEVNGQSSSSGLISGNGTNSTNTITDVNTKSSSIKQKAKTRVGALVGSKAKTGKNRANGNTGSGTTINTGNAGSSATVDVIGGTNVLNP